MKAAVVPIGLIVKILHNTSCAVRDNVKLLKQNCVSLGIGFLLKLLSTTSTFLIFTHVYTSEDRNLCVHSVL